ncbi:potassium channel subfamily K member 4 [Morone saxatilis]|uniref:potassium channel subfamily K member 4 n=1 Tax=Morone saxatilis TaxID=34816 RepID=UPI0015E212A7|nr:potassium channel subfamily K member 4 [Morone saxatilis]
MRCTTLLALLTGVMLYLVMGALVFRTLEAPDENSAYKDLLATKHTFLDNKSCVTELEFHKLVKGVASAVEAGLDVRSLPANFTSRWDLASAFFFCGTIITTIGELSPHCFIKSSLMCNYCSSLKYLLLFILPLYLWFASLSQKRKVRPTTVRVISAVLSILIGCLIFLAVPTVVFQKVEDWSFLESLYFVVITLTTVGFGDYVPGGGREGMFFKPLVLLWIVFGLAYFASILTMIGNWLRVLSKRTRAEMEELRAHATDWTQNIQNMSMDFRIPNPLEFNDPFLLQRRRWKRSERRRIRRGAQVTLGHWARGASENGHLPNRWGGLSNSMSQLEAHSSLERAVVAKSRPRVTAAGGGTGPRLVPGLRVDPTVGLQVEGRPFPHLLARSFSLPVARSTLELDSAGAALQGRSMSGSESPFDSRSDVSSVSSSFLALHRFQPCCTVSSMEEGGARATEMNTAQEKNRLILAEKYESAANNSHKHTPAPVFLPHSSSLPPFIPSSRQSIVLPSPPLNMASSASCQLLDFFGENLAYIDESSDTLSDRAQPAASEGRKRRPRKPKRRSMRKQLSHRWSPTQVRRSNSDMRPPSNPPTPPPDSSLSDLPPSENQTGSAQPQSQDVTEHNS